jgi:hypothetical protein
LIKLGKKKGKIKDYLQKVSFKLTIKKTVNKKTPYIGILKYREKVFRSKDAKQLEQ